MGIMNPRSLWMTLTLIAIFSLIPMMSLAADADRLKDFCVADSASALTINGLTCKPANKVSINDFKFDRLMKPDNTNNANNVVVTSASVVQFPGLYTLGISAVRIDFAKGGINPPHTHPRATELLLLVKGELYVGFAVEYCRSKD